MLPEIKMTVTELAKYLGYSRGQLSNVLHCRAPISADLAWRLEMAGLGKAHMWLARQSAYDLWQAHRTPAADKATMLASKKWHHRER